MVNIDRNAGGGNQGLIIPQLRQIFPEKYVLNHVKGDGKSYLSHSALEW